MNKKLRGAARIADRSVNERMTPEMRTLVNSNAELVKQAWALHKPVAVRDDRPGDWFRIENATAEEASIYIYDEIGYWGTSAAAFVEELNAISAPKLVIHINSPGGEVFDGVAIHTALMASKSHITVEIDGLAASAASFIAMAGDNIRMARHATMMIHDASGMAWGNATTMRAYADLLDKLTLNIADIYSLQAGGTAQEWFDRMNDDEIWYTGQEALAAGLVDEITMPDEPADKLPSPPTRLSLAAFNYAGRPSAPDPFIPSDPNVDNGEEGGSGGNEDVINVRTIDSPDDEWIKAFAPDPWVKTMSTMKL